MSAGKGFWIWIASRVEGGSITRAVEKAKEAGLGHVCIKIADAYYRYNYDEESKTDYAARYIKAFLDAGIEVWAWQYIYLDRPEKEADMAILRMAELPRGISRFIVNAERESKYKPTQATTYMSRLKQGITVPVGLSSYRWPSYHMTFPWASFEPYLDFNIPQIYWMHGTDPAGQLRRSIKEFKDIYPNMPYIPTGAAFREHGWQPADWEIKEFLDECKAQGFDTVNFWEWANARAYGLWDAVATYNWESSPTPPLPPAPVMFRIRCITTALNVRSGPSTAYPIVGGLRFGEIAEVFEISSGGWYRIGDNRWCSGSTSYVQKVDESITPPGETPPLTKLYYPCDPRFRITQYFGVNPGTYTISKGHNGVDFGTPVGNPIYAAADGVVEVAKEQTNGYGRHIRIRHSHGLTIYGHMSQNGVKVGDHVKAKQIIGLSGGAVTDPYAGMSSGPHLHFEYRWDIPAPQVPGGFVYNAVDPLPLLVAHEEADPLFQARCVSDALNVRSGPGITYGIVGGLVRGDVVNVYEVSGNSWFRIGLGRWCSGHPQYMEKIGEVPIPEPPPDDPDLIHKMKVVATLLNVRSGPGVSHPIVDTIKKGTKVEIRDVGGSDAWAQIGKDQWVAVEVRNTRYVTDGKVTANVLNVRSGAGVSNAIVGSLYKGDRVEFEDVGGTDAWVRIGIGRWSAAVVRSSRYMKRV